MKTAFLPAAQIVLFEPTAEEALDSLGRHAKLYRAASEASELWGSCWVPGARDEADRQADQHFADWLECALYLDLGHVSGLAA